MHPEKQNNPEPTNKNVDVVVAPPADMSQPASKAVNPTTDFSQKTDNSVSAYHSAEATEGKNKHKEGIRSLLSTLMLFVGALFLAIAINTFFFQSYEVDGSSMEPTLQNGNRLIIWKLPRTIARFTGKKYIPNRGDIIVFHKKGPVDEQLIKRVIGLPGERVVVAKGQITIFNSEHPEGFNPDSLKDYGKALEATYGDVDTVVEEGRIFVCGDNRAPGGSLDSRFGLGTIESSSIVGKLKVRLFPLNEINGF